MVLDPAPFKKFFELRVYCKMAKSIRKQAERYFCNYLQEKLILTCICFDFLKKIYSYSELFFAWFYKFFGYFGRKFWK
jgi:hypothetical protein